VADIQEDSITSIIRNVILGQTNVGAVVEDETRHSGRRARPRESAVEQNQISVDIAKCDAGTYTARIDGEILNDVRLEERPTARLVHEIIKFRVIIQCKSGKIRG
jgi:hypothetical protein